jgi:proline dehydrogenase
MTAPLPGPRAGHTPEAAPERTTVPGVLARTRPGTGDVLRLAAELVDGGCSVALEQVPGGGTAADYAELCARLADTGLAPHCELGLPVDRLGTEAVVALAESGPAVALAGSRAAVTAAAARLPTARIVGPAAELGAEAWCRDVAHRRVRLTAGRGARADLAFVRCLNVLMAGGGHPAVATADPRLVAIAGERAAWNDRTPDSWEHVMPYRVRVHDRRRLLAAGYRVRVVLGAGRGSRP